MRGIVFRISTCLIVVAVSGFVGVMPPAVADDPITAPPNPPAVVVPPAGADDPITAPPNPPAVVVPPSGLRALFKWRVPERIRDDRYDQATASYVPGYVNPSRWGVFFDACISRPDVESVPIVSYQWQIKRIGDVEPSPLTWTFETDKCMTWATGQGAAPEGAVPADQPAPAEGGVAAPAQAEDVVIIGDTILAAPNGPGNDTPPGTDDEEHATMPAFISLGTYQVKLTVRDTINRTADFVQTVVLRDYLIVVLGDSFAAGQGNPDWPGKASGYPLWIFTDLIDHFFPNSGVCESTKAVAAYLTLQGSGSRVSMDWDPRWVEERAWRSYRSGHVQGAKRIELGDPHTSVTLLSFASSGAETVDLVDRAQRAFQREKLNCTALDCGQIREVEEAVGDRTIDALIMSIGGNDVGFSDALRSALTSKFPESETRDDIELRIRSLPASYRSVADELKQRLKIERTFITGYPIDVFSESDGNTGSGCGIFTQFTSFPSVDGVTTQDAEALRELAIKLNAEVEAAARAHDWIFVPTGDLFHTHGYCSKAGTYFRGAEASCVIQGDVEGTMHPNEKGHDVVGFRIFDELKKWLPTGGELVDDPVVPSDEPALQDDFLR